MDCFIFWDKMQVLKKICFVLCGFVLASCSSNSVKDEGWSNSFVSDVEEINISTNDSFRVGMLLPLSGSDAKYGTGLKYASMLALQDINNPNLVLQYYDTQSSVSGARVAIENAINQQSDLIIGPLKSTEVQAISNETIYQGIPVIAFSTAQEVLQPTVYTLGLMLEEQVDRIMTYAAQNKGRKRFALLLPDNSTGGAVAKAAVKSAQKNGVEVKVIGFYTPGTSDFSEIVKQMTNYEKRHARVLNVKNKLEALHANGDKKAEKALKKISTREGLGDVGFDAVIIPETGAKLTSAISMFAYYDAGYPDVQFLGTSLWNLSRLNNEAVIVKSLYPTVTKFADNEFANQYYLTFGEKPSSLYTLAYDAINIANRLAEDTGENINEKITTINGFSGLNGKVRFFKNGANQHSLDIVEIVPSGNIVVDSGDVQFETVNESLETVDITNNYCMPKIYGKDETLAQIVIYGQTMSDNSAEYSGVCIETDDAEVVQKQLKDMGIYIN